MVYMCNLIGKSSHEVKNRKQIVEAVVEAIRPVLKCKMCLMVKFMIDLWENKLEKLN